MKKLLKKIKGFFTPRESQFSNIEIEYAFQEAVSKQYNKVYKFGDPIEGAPNELFIPSNSSGNYLYLYYDAKEKTSMYKAFNREKLKKSAVAWDKAGRPEIKSNDSKIFYTNEN